MRARLLRSLVSLAVVSSVAAGCSSSGAESPAPAPASSNPPGASDGTKTPDPVQVSDPTQPKPTPLPDGGGGVVTGGVLQGMVSRTAAVPGGQDGVGDLYVGVFDKNPLTDQSAQPIGNQLIKDVNLAAASAKVAYKVTGLPTTGAQVFVVAFFDDDGNASTDQQPHKPDLVTLDGLGPVKVTLDTNGPTTKDLVLNAEMPF
jgi:hypothetical protein